MKKVFLFIIIILSLVFISQTSYFTLSDITFNDGDYGEALEIEKIIGNDLNYFVHSNAYIKEKLLQVPMIESVTVKKGYPNKVNLDIIYKAPFLKVVDNGVIVIIDDTGYVLAINKNLETDYIVTGLELSYYKVNHKLEIYDEEILLNLIDLIKLVNKSNVAIHEEIEYNDENIELLTYKGIKGRFGDCSEVEKKFNNFVNVYHDLINKDVRSGIIDVSITDLPLYKRKNN